MSEEDLRCAKKCGPCCLISLSEFDYADTTVVAGWSELLGDWEVVDKKLVVEVTNDEIEEVFDTPPGPGPDGYTIKTRTIDVECIAASGDGADADGPGSGTGRGGGGGGGGEFRASYDMSVTPGELATISVGDRAAQGGGTGGIAEFGTNYPALEDHVKANGGTSGGTLGQNWNKGVGGTGGSGDVGFDGGDGADGIVLASGGQGGGGGGSASDAGAGGDASGQTGGTAPAGGGDGGDGGNANGNGVAGSFPGGGGGGGGTAGGLGALGARGKVTLRYTVDQALIILDAAHPDGDDGKQHIVFDFWNTAFSDDGVVNPAGVVAFQDADNYLYAEVYHDDNACDYLRLYQYIDGALTLLKEQILPPLVLDQNYRLDVCWGPVYEAYGSGYDGTGLLRAKFSLPGTGLRPIVIRAAGIVAVGDQVGLQLGEGAGKFDNYEFDYMKDEEDHRACPACADGCKIGIGNFTEDATSDGDGNILCQWHEEVADVAISGGALEVAEGGRAKYLRGHPEGRNTKYILFTFDYVAGLIFDIDFGGVVATVDADEQTLTVGGAECPLPDPAATTSLTLEVGYDGTNLKARQPVEFFFTGCCAEDVLEADDDPYVYFEATVGTLRITAFEFEKYRNYTDPLEVSCKTMECPKPCGVCVGSVIGSEIMGTIQGTPTFTDIGAACVGIDLSAGIGIGLLMNWTSDCAFLRVVDFPLYSTQANCEEDFDPDNNGTGSTEMCPDLDDCSFNPPPGPDPVFTWNCICYLALTSVGVQFTNLGGGLIGILATVTFVGNRFYLYPADGNGIALTLLYYKEVAEEDFDCTDFSIELDYYLGPSSGSSDYPPLFDYSGTTFLVES